MNCCDKDIGVYFAGAGDSDDNATVTSDEERNLIKEIEDEVSENVDSKTQGECEVYRSVLALQAKVCESRLWLWPRLYVMHSTANAAHVACGNKC